MNGDRLKFSPLGTGRFLLLRYAMWTSYLLEWHLLVAYVWCVRVEFSPTIFSKFHCRFPHKICLLIDQAHIENILNKKGKEKKNWNKIWHWWWWWWCWCCTSGKCQFFCSLFDWAENARMNWTHRLISNLNVWTAEFTLFIRHIQRLGSR